MKNVQVAELIKKKRDGNSLTKTELSDLITGYVAGEVPDYQMAAFLMAVVFKSMTHEETWHLTDVMMNSGQVLDFSYLGFPVDKHSTGGIGDKTSLILAPIAAACGVKIPMIAGRGLGHTGGTIDKLESIPGFSVDISVDKFKTQVETLGLALIGQTAQICPADKKIYALRDVTATVESLPLICASIMSKKIAEGISGLVLDVKWGTGAFMKTQEKAIELATALCEIGKIGKKKVTAFVTSMNEPLGRFVGNSLEIEESIAILRQESLRDHKLEDFSDCADLSTDLAAAMINMAQPKSALKFSEARKMAVEVLANGRAYEKFEKLVSEQGGRLSELPKAKLSREILAQQDGFANFVDCEQVGYAGIELKAGRRLASDKIDPTSGIEFLVRQGEKVIKGQPLYRLYAQNQPESAIQAAEARMGTALKLSSTPLRPAQSEAKALANHAMSALITQVIEY